ncbi:MAG TPA: FAD-dependent monooxygenase, partial [Ktedonobacteraceae bacterium]
MHEDAAAHRHVAVVIVGAGPTGLVAANLLGQEGIETLLLECHPGISDIPRAITLDDEGLRICQAIGLYEEMCADMLLDVQAHYVSQGRLLARVAPTGRDNGHPFVSTLHQPTFEATLLRGLGRFPCIEVCFQHTVTAVEQHEQSIHLTVQCMENQHITIPQHITCDYLLACDGGKSMIRQWLAISMHTLSGPFFVPTSQRHARSSQRWLVVDGSETTSQGENIITFFCTPTRPAVTVPAPEQRRRWEFMLLPGEQEEDVLHQQGVYEM